MLVDVLQSGEDVQTRVALGAGAEAGAGTEAGAGVGSGARSGSGEGAEAVVGAGARLGINNFFVNSENQEIRI